MKRLRVPVIFHCCARVLYRHLRFRRNPRMTRVRNILCYTSNSNNLTCVCVNRVFSCGQEESFTVQGMKTDDELARR